MRIAVDVERCTGHGICEGIAEDIFEVNDEGYVVVLDATPGEDRRAEVEQAVAECPTRALALED